MSFPAVPPNTEASYGWCDKCRVEHRLTEGSARRHAIKLMQELAEIKRIDHCVSAVHADPQFSTDYLYGPALGQMFGVLECLDDQGKTVVLRAFSGQYNAAWKVAGWVPPVFDVETYAGIMIPADVEIKKLGRQIDGLDATDGQRALLIQQRKQVSQSTMKELHTLYELHNFCNETKPITSFFKDGKGIPTGAGDCCAPKLLDFAACNNLHPLGISEFYWGATNRSGTYEQSHFYSCCESRCQPILGFMLCGIK